MADGRVKLYLTAKILNFRRDHRALFAEGSYVPLQTSGRNSDHAIAFARALEDCVVVVVVPRLLVTLVGGVKGLPMGNNVWHDTSIALDALGDEECSYQNILTEEQIRLTKRAGGLALPLCSILQSFPVALLKRIQARPSFG
jgi:(1->4)-alpha-D-glucan 1-alpha-D-glucosylmutase